MVAKRTPMMMPKGRRASKGTPMMTIGVEETGIEQCTRLNWSRSEGKGEAGVAAGIRRSSTRSGGWPKAV